MGLMSAIYKIIKNITNGEYGAYDGLKDLLTFVRERSKTKKVE